MAKTAREIRIATNTSGSTATLNAYNDAGELLMETNSGGPLNGIAVVSTYDSKLRRTAVSVVNGGTTLTTTGYGYDYASRLAQLSNGTFSATYTYLANSPLVSQI